MRKTFLLSLCCAALLGLVLPALAAAAPAAPAGDPALAAIFATDLGVPEPLDLAIVKICGPCGGPFANCTHLCPAGYTGTCYGTRLCIAADDEAYSVNCVCTN